MEYDCSSQKQLCKYALLLAHHILELINYHDMDNEIIKEVFSYYRIRNYLYYFLVLFYLYVYNIYEEKIFIF